MSDINWKETEEYLKECESAYAEIGVSCSFALTMLITPARVRFDSGERTQELHDEIKSISL